MSRLTMLTVALAAVVAVPSAGWAQQESGQPSPEVQQLLVERQQLQIRLAEIQDEALEDEALQGQQDAVSNAVRNAMIEADPSMAQKLDRLEAMMQEARAAQASGDMERITALTAEAQTLQPEIRQAQAAALARPEIEEQVDAFQLALRTRMSEIDAEAPALMERLEAVELRLQAQLGGA
jgi:hypothetical protein